MRQINLVLALLFFGAQAHAQFSEVRGNVTDELNNPFETADILLYDNERVVISIQSDENGNYELVGVSPETFAQLYGMRLDNQGNLAPPRIVQLGCRFNF